MYATDFAALIAQAAKMQATINAQLLEKFQKDYDGWLTRKSWGKQVAGDVMPVPGPSIVISVTMNADQPDFVVKLGPPVAPMPQPDAPATSQKAVGKLIFGNEYESTPYGDTFPANYVLDEDGSKYLKVKRANPFSGDGDSDSWVKLS